MPEVAALDDLIAGIPEVSGLQGGRVIIGITGAPGAGKTTLVEQLLRRLPDAAWVPMDGFHLSDSSLRRLGLLERKGAIDTFDGWGFLAMLRRLRVELDHDVYAPEFERAIEQPIAAGTVVPAAARLVFTEGNYLLDDSAPWLGVRAELDQVWYCDAPDAVRQERLVRRHVAFGKSSERARAWVAEVDESNARRVIARRELATHIVDMSERKKS